MIISFYFGYYSEGHDVKVPYIDNCVIVINSCLSWPCTIIPVKDGITYPSIIFLNG